MKITVEDVRKKFNAEQLQVLNELADGVVEAARKLAENNIFAEEGEIMHRLYAALYGTEDGKEQDMINSELYMRKGCKSDVRRIL